MTFLPEIFKAIFAIEGEKYFVKIAVFVFFTRDFRKKRKNSCKNSPSKKQKTKKTGTIFHIFRFSSLFHLKLPFFVDLQKIKNPKKRKNR